MSVAENIIKLRKKKCISQAQLAERVGICQSMVAQIERGSKIPSVILANSIAKALDGNLSDIVAE